MSKVVINIAVLDVESEGADNMSVNHVIETVPNPRFWVNEGYLWVAVPFAGQEIYDAARAVNLDMDETIFASVVEWVMQKDSYLSRTDDKTVRGAYESYPDDAIVEWMEYDPEQSPNICFRMVGLPDVEFGIIQRQ
jgi:hypothetical protein